MIQKKEPNVWDVWTYIIPILNRFVVSCEVVWIITLAHQMTLKERHKGSPKDFIFQIVIYYK